MSKYYNVITLVEVRAVGPELRVRAFGAEQWALRSKIRLRTSTSESRTSKTTELQLL